MTAKGVSHLLLDFDLSQR